MNQNTAPSHELSSSPVTHVAETINMLYLAVCQIETTMTDANSSVDTLTNSFTRLANHTREVSNHAQNVDRIEELDGFKQDISETADELQDNISQAIQAFQFYDRVCQRIDHVARSLEKVSRLLGNKQEIDEIGNWKNVQNQIKSSYTMEAERIMFEFIMRGGSVEEALKIYQHHFSQEPDDKDDVDEIELF